MLAGILPGGQFLNLKNITTPELISSILVLIMIIASVLFVFLILTGGVRWMLSGDKKDKLEKAQNQLVNVLIGLMIVFCAMKIFKPIRV